MGQGEHSVVCLSHRLMLTRKFRVLPYNTRATRQTVPWRVWVGQPGVAPRRTCCHLCGLLSTRSDHKRSLSRTCLQEQMLRVVLCLWCFGVPGLVRGGGDMTETYGGLLGLGGRVCTETRSICCVSTTWSGTMMSTLHGVADMRTLMTRAVRESTSNL